MKRVYQVAIVAVLLLAPAVVSLPAQAQADCEISNTGPGSENECSVEQNYTCEVVNSNTVKINGETVQVSTSGDTDNNDNTDGGNATTGTATNSSGTAFNVTIRNGESCEVAVAPTPEPPVTPETPEEPTPGRGGASAPVQPAQKVTPAALPVTSGDTAPLIFLTGSIAVVAALAVAYRRLF